MKQLLKHTILLLFLAIKSFAQLGINATGTAPATSAMLDVSSTSKGFLPPRMTTTQRTAITSPAEGLLVFDTNTKSNWYFNGSIWINDVPGAALTLPYNGSQNYVGPLFQLTNSSTNLLTSTISTINTGAGTAINAKNSGTGSAGFFEITNSSNPEHALFAFTKGTGSAILGNGDFYGNAISGYNQSATKPTGILVNFDNNGLALRIQGGFKVSGTESQKAAFKITSTAGNIYVNQLRIPNTTQANNPNDILIITHNYGSGATNNFIKPCGVYWDAGFSEWRIYVEDSTNMPVGITFNVLVIKQ